MSAVHSRRRSLRCKRPRPSEMPVAMHYPPQGEPACCNELGHHHQANIVQVRSRVQVSLEDAEILMATAHRISVAGQVTCGPYQTYERRTPLKDGWDPVSTEARHHSLQLLNSHLDGSELQRSASGPVLNPVQEHIKQLHKAASLPAGISLPGQSASPPPVKVPKGIRSNRLRKQSSSPASAPAGKILGKSPAKALGVKRNGGASRVVKSSSVAQDEFIKSFRPSPTRNSDGCSGMLLLLEACDALAANPLLAENSLRPNPSTRRDDWASASPLARAGRSEHKTRRVNLLDEGAYETAPTANGRRIRKPLDNDFLYYSQASNMGSSMEYGGQTSGEGAQEARGGSYGGEEGFWNPRGRRRGGRGELQGPCNHCFAEDSPQWRKGPRCKPVLCNACGTRFLRTRSLGKVRNTRSKMREVQQSRFAEPSLHDMMDEDVHMDCTVSSAHAWGGGPKNDSLTHEQDNVSSSTTVPGMAMAYGSAQNPHDAVSHDDCDHQGDGIMIGTAGGCSMLEDCASAAVMQ